jgi:hypothetical protein
MTGDATIAMTVVDAIIVLVEGFHYFFVIHFCS